MKVELDENFVMWFKITNPHLYRKKVKASERNQEIKEYVNDVLLEHLEYMQELLAEDGEEDDAPDGGFRGQ